MDPQKGEMTLVEIARARVYEAYGSMDGKELSDLSHKFQRDMTYVNCNSDKAVPLYPIAFKAATEG